MKTKELIKKRLLDEIAVRAQQLTWLDSIPGLEQLDIGDINASFLYAHQLDLDNLTHAQVIEVIKAVGGKWDKTPADNGCIDYQQKIGEFYIRMWRGAPPPNCKIVEYLEEIPAQPARTVTKRKLQCI